MHTDCPVLGDARWRGVRTNGHLKSTPGRAPGSPPREVPLDSRLEMKVHPMERGRDWHPGRASRTGQGTGQRARCVQKAVRQSGRLKRSSRGGPRQEGPWVQGQGAGPFPGDGGRMFERQQEHRQWVCPGRGCVAVAEAWFPVRSATWLWAGDSSGSLSLLICQMDAAMVARSGAAASGLAQCGAGASAGRGQRGSLGKR